MTRSIAPIIPFGGMKASGIGRYNADTVDEFTELKWLSTQREPREFPL